MKFRIFMFSILLIYIVLIFLPIILWYVQKPLELNISIIDKTVPNESYREHLGFNGLLNNHKVVDESGALYKLEEDYYGYHPYDATGDQIYPLNENLDLIYVADTYGVYDEVIDNNGSRYIYGGLNIFEWNRIMYSKGKETILILEYGSLGLPTDDLTRGIIERNLSVQYTGWYGKYYSHLQEDVAQQIKESYKNQTGDNWGFYGEGIILVNDQIGQLVVLTDKDINGALNFELTSEGKEHYKGAENSTFSNWFEIVVPNKESIVEGFFKIDASTAGIEKLGKSNIPTQFPAIVYNSEANTYYFAGDFAEQDKNYWSKWKLPKNLKKTISYLQNRDEFLWKSYNPIIKTILVEASIK